MADRNTEEEIMIDLIHSHEIVAFLFYSLVIIGATVGPAWLAHKLG